MTSNGKKEITQLLEIGELIEPEIKSEIPTPAENYQEVLLSADIKVLNKLAKHLLTQQDVNIKLEKKIINRYKLAINNAIIYMYNRYLNTLEPKWEVKLNGV